MYLELNGEDPSAEDLADVLIGNYAHITVMQVRAGHAKGLTLHLDRLRNQHHELFDQELDTDRVRDFVRSAISGHPDGTVRVRISASGGQPQVLVSIGPPVDAPLVPHSLQSVQHERAVAHIKHAGSFAQLYYGTRAQKAGFHDALFTDAKDRVLETTMYNIGFV